MILDMGLSPKLEIRIGRPACIAIARKLSSRILLAMGIFKSLVFRGILKILQ